MMQLAKKPVVAVAETRRQQAVGDVCSTLLDAMRCIMVADGKVEKAEKQVIQKVMANANHSSEATKNAAPRQRLALRS